MPTSPGQPPGGRATTWGDSETVIHLGGFVVVPLLAVAIGVAAAWWLWRRDPAADPARHLGRVGAVVAAGFHLDRAQQALVVQPVQALAGAVRHTDESIVDGAVEGTGRGTAGLGALLHTAHRAGLPRAVGAVLAGAVVLGVAAAVLGGVR